MFTRPKLMDPFQIFGLQIAMSFLFWGLLARMLLLGLLPLPPLGQLPPLQFDPADALGFLSSNAAVIGEAALACANLRDLLGAAVVTGALAFLGTEGNPEAYDEFVHRAPRRA